jgi:hypothetical protein
MRTAVPDKILKIIGDIDAEGNAPTTRLTALKKWFEGPGRLAAFGLWIAAGAAGQMGKTKGEAGALLDEARALLGPAVTTAAMHRRIDRRKAATLRVRARDFQNEHERQRWGSVRIIQCWPLLLVEQGLALHLGLADAPADGYRLAADWARHYDPRYGTGLNGPSRGRLRELARFMVAVEALEAER